MTYEPTDARHTMVHDANAKMVSAQEVACFAYCPEQWRLQYGLGLPPTNGAALAAGTRHHARNAAAERVASALIVLGIAVVLAAAAALLIRVVGQWG